MQMNSQSSDDILVQAFGGANANHWPQYEVTNWLRKNKFHKLVPIFREKKLKHGSFMQLTLKALVFLAIDTISLTDAAKVIERIRASASNPFEPVFASQEVAPEKFYIRARFGIELRQLQVNFNLEQPVADIKRAIIQSLKLPGSADQYTFKKGPFVTDNTLDTPLEPYIRFEDESDFIRHCCRSTLKHHVEILVEETSYLNKHMVGLMMACGDLINNHKELLVTLSGSATNDINMGLSKLMQDLEKYSDVSFVTPVISKYIDKGKAIDKLAGKALDKKANLIDDCLANASSLERITSWWETRNATEARSPILSSTPTLMSPRVMTSPSPSDHPSSSSSTETPHRASNDSGNSSGTRSSSEMRPTIAAQSPFSITTEKGHRLSSSDARHTVIEHRPSIEVHPPTTTMTTAAEQSRRPSSDTRPSVDIRQSIEVRPPAMSQQRAHDTHPPSNGHRGIPSSELRRPSFVASRSSTEMQETQETHPPFHMRSSLGSPRVIHTYPPVERIPILLSGRPLLPNNGNHGQTVKIWPKGELRVKLTPPMPSEHQSVPSEKHFVAGPSNSGHPSTGIMRMESNHPVPGHAGHSFTGMCAPPTSQAPSCVSDQNAMESGSAGQLLGMPNPPMRMSGLPSSHDAGQQRMALEDLAASTNAVPPFHMRISMPMLQLTVTTAPDDSWPSTRRQSPFSPSRDQASYPQAHPTSQQRRGQQSGPLAVRPPVTELFRELDKFLPDCDLDAEIRVPQPSTSPKMIPSGLRNLEMASSSQGNNYSNWMSSFIDAGRSVFSRACGNTRNMVMRRTSIRSIAENRLQSQTENESMGSSRPTPFTAYRVSQLPPEATLAKVIDPTLSMGVGRTPVNTLRFRSILSMPMSMPMPSPTRPDSSSSRNTQIRAKSIDTSSQKHATKNADMGTSQQQHQHLVETNIVDDTYVTLLSALTSPSSPTPSPHATASSSVVSSMAMTRGSVRRNLCHLDSGRSSDHSLFDHFLHHLPSHRLHANIQWARGRLLGKGGFGRVYLRFHMPTRKLVAAKELEIKRRGAHQDAPMDQLNEEIRLLAKLDHTNIVKYHGHEVNLLDSRLIIFMEYVPGGSLSNLLKNRGPLVLSAIKHFTRQILMGLVYIHGRSITHRDIKADNILVDDRGACKISDFGLSRINHGSVSMPSMGGTVYNMAPEVVNNNGYTYTADIWSLACTIIEMWTADHPWPNQEEVSVIFKLGNGVLPPIPDNCPAVMLDLLTSCFVDQQHRPTASELLENHAFVQEDPKFDYSRAFGTSSG